MNERSGSEHHESVSSLIATPKSSVWQGFLGAAWVLSSSLLLEVVAKLLEGSVGQSHVLNSLAGVLRWVAVGVVSIAALYVLWRKCTDMRESFRIRRELDLTADLVEPPIVADAEPKFLEPGAATTDRCSGAPRDPDIAGVLGELPFDCYESAALYDMVTAMLDCADVLPREHAVAYRDASGVLARLTADGVVVHVGHDRFQVNKTGRIHDSGAVSVDPDVGVAGIGGTRRAQDVRRTPQWRAALPALVGHYADLADRWSVALDSERLGAGAHRWFTGSSGRLEELLRECGTFDHGIRLDITAPARIADALDIWYARIGVRGCRQAAGAMCTLAEAESGKKRPPHPEIAELAALRRGDLGEPAARRGLVRRARHRGPTGLRARRAHEKALRLLEQYQDASAVATADAVSVAGSDPADGTSARTNGPAVDAAPIAGATVTATRVPDPHADDGSAVVCGAADDSGPIGGESPRRTWFRSRRRRSRGQTESGLLSAAVDEFERSWWLLPRRDVAGEVATLIDLGIAHLYEGRLDAARDRLELAETLTRGGRNPSGRAHTFEILGVLWWMRGEPRRALRWWLLALSRYRDLGHDLGIRRCLQHLGTAIVVVPDYGGLLLAGTPGRDEMLGQAWTWLQYAKRRPDCPQQEDPPLTGLYQERIRKWLDRTDDELAATAMRWPTVVTER